MSQKNIIIIIDMLLNLDIDLDILVIDDNSPDNTAQIVKKYDSDKVFIQERAKKKRVRYCLCAWLQLGAKQ